MSSLFIPLDLKVTPHKRGEVFPVAIAQGIEPAAKFAADHLQSRLHDLFTGADNHHGSSSAETGERTAKILSDQPGVSVSLPEGKMFGVLVVKNDAGLIGYLAAFSGKLQGSWCIDGFVPPPFDVAATTSLLSNANQELKHLQSQLECLQSSPDYHRQLKAKEELKHSFECQIAELQLQHRLRKQQRAVERRAVHADTTAPAESKGFCTLPANDVTVAGRKILARLTRQSQHDKQERKELRRLFDTELHQIEALVQQHEDRIGQLEIRRQQLSRHAQHRYFAGFKLYDAEGDVIPVLLKNDNSTKASLPPSGTGECAAPKLLSYAHQYGYEPVCGTEFWWGPSPAGKIRHHKTFYPPCHSKCRELLPRMQNSPSSSKTQHCGLGIHTDIPEDLAIEILFEDRHIVVVGKPAGLLSVPGKTYQVSLYDWARRKWPDASGPLLVHRLDMDTSGLVLLALDKSAHKLLQKQFMQRSVKKTYTALVAGKVKQEFGREGRISLPLRVDLDDRPRQMVCYEHGRSAETCWKLVEEKLSGNAETITRMSLQPVTGRTHQLRVHMASAEGMNMPIIGDPLYAPVTISCAYREAAKRPGEAGSGIQINNNHQAMPASRMMLHAETLEFMHPVKRENLLVSLKAPF